MEIRFEVGDLTELEIEAIVNPANSEGEMGGGVAGVIRKKGGKHIEEAAMEQAPIPIGKAVLTEAGGKLKCRYVIHAPTMETPVQRTSVEKIQKAVRAALVLAREEEIRHLAIPGMGTGTGKVPVEAAAQAMTDIIKSSDKLTGQIDELVLVDINADMVAAWQQFWHLQPEEEKTEADTEETSA